ncbi:ABC transporter ATP-binding protein [Georgenia yuyongxinii]|uniref:ABC transporter ATP-binding protein n=1 Tax=Georgenia yuyongxinii TaxID=2589797 RepID=A0A5B8C3Q4_9MICO|nr:ABC transporter ATP-binding protein [Georgenia yuyongxinii]QDC23915.1 ABC transporter ATP-binding protein [Georgenia yuyongxinii]
MTVAPPARQPRPRTNPVTVLRRATAAWRRLSPFFRTSPTQMLLLVIGSVIAGFAEAALLGLVAAIAGALSQGQTEVAVHVGPVSLHASGGVMLGAAAALAVTRGALQLLLAYLPASMSARAVASLRRRLFDAFTVSAWPVKAAERDGQFQSLMSTHINSSSQAIISLGNGLSVLLVFFSLLVSAFALNLPAAVVLTVASVGLFLGLRPLAGRLRRQASKLSAENIEYSKAVQEVVLMAEETEVFGATRTYRDGFYTLIDAVRQPMLRTRFLSSAVPTLYQSIALLMLVVALAVVSLMGTERIATLGGVVLILVRALTYGQQIQTAMTNLDERIPFMHRLADAIENYVSHPRQDGEQPLPVIEWFGLRDVGYTYPGGREVLRGVSFTVAMGEAIGVVGPSGAGKSSLVQMLLRLRDPAHGSVQVNGRDVREFRRDDWQRRVAYVPQTPQLIWGTVADNIRYHRPHLSDADVEAAARRARIHDEIMSWPDGYDTVVGQRAAAVSGGQSQRICLARALADQPEVLILDEPTSALDVRSEALVHESLGQLKGEMLIFLVAHRLTTLSFCDRVMVVVDGQIEDFDAPDHLLATNGFFREITEITRSRSN